MRNKLFFSGIIGILLIFTFVVGCSNGTTTEIEVLTPKGPDIHTQAPPVFETPPPPVIGDPAKTFSELITALVNAEEIIKSKPDSPVSVAIAGQIHIPENETITVGNDVTLVINKGARLTVNANAILFIRRLGTVDVQGVLTFEDFGNGDDVRQTKLEGKLIANGGTIYDKSDAGFLLQYVSAIREGGRLVYGGGNAALGSDREKNLIGNPVFTGKDAEGNIIGEIRLVFGGGWSRQTPVAFDSTYPTETTIVGIKGSNIIPHLEGFEIVGNVTVSEKSIIIPNRGGNVNELRLYVRQGARLVLAKDASLMTETLETTGGADRVGPGSLVVEPGASIEVSGKLYYPSGPRTTNLGAITVKDIGTFTWDTDDISAYAIPVSLGTMTFEYGSSFYKNRVDPKLFFSAIGGEITTGNGTTIIITDKVFSFTGKYDDKSRTVVRDKETIDELNTRWLTRGGLVIDVVGVVVDLTANGAQIAVSTVNVKKPEKATGKGPFAKLIISSNTGGLGTGGLEILNVTDSTEVDIKAPAWVSLESGAGSGAKLNLTNATATIAAPANETASDLLVGLINGTDSKDAIVNYKGFDFAFGGGLVVNTTDAGTASTEAAIVGFSFADPIDVTGDIELITPKKASFNGDVTITTGGVIITDAGTVEVFFGDTENSTTETLTVPQAFTITNSKVTVEAVVMGDTSSSRDLNLTKGSILTITDTFEFTDNQANTITLDTAGASDLSTIRGNPIDRTVAGTTTKSKPKILNTSSNSTSLAITAQDALGLLLTPPGSLPGTHSGGLATDEWSDWEVPSTGGSATWSAIKSP